MFSKKEIVVFVGAQLFNVFLMIALHDRDCTLFLTFCVAMWCVIYFIMYLIKKNITKKCKQCGAKGSMRYLGKKCIGKKEIRRLKETDSTGRRVQPYYVYGRMLYYKEAFRCNCCGHMTFNTYEEEEWDDENVR